MADPYIKALHIIFIVTWFAGLFYVVRLFIYHVEAATKAEPEKSILTNQLGLMTKKLWTIIAWPSAILTLFFGAWMIINMPSMLELPFMQVKLAFVVVLYVYHFMCQKIYTQLQQGIVKYSSTQLRIFNEIATVILVSVVFIIVLKHDLNWLKGTIGFVLFSVILMIAVKIYKKIREKNRHK